MLDTIGYLFDNAATLIGDFVIALFWGAAFAVIGAAFASSMTDIKLGGSDPNMEGLPATLFGIVVGGLLGFAGTIWELNDLAVGKTLSHMLCFWVIVAVACFVITRLYSRARNHAPSEKGNTKRRPF